MQFKIEVDSTEDPGLVMVDCLKVIADLIDKNGGIGPQGKANIAVWAEPDDDLADDLPNLTWRVTASGSVTP